MTMVMMLLLCLLPLSVAANWIGTAAETDNEGCCRMGQQLEITISGGLGITITATNIGDFPIENISWIISLSGLICFGNEVSGHVNILQPGESISAFLLAFGIGPGSLMVAVNNTTASVDFWLIGPFVIGI